jgi:hypothetical protein
LTSTIEYFSSLTLGRCSGGQQRDRLDAVGVVELEQIVQEAEQHGLVVLASEDALEHEVGLGVGEDRASHGPGRTADPSGVHGSSIWMVMNQRRQRSAGVRTQSTLHAMLSRR